MAKGITVKEAKAALKNLKQLVPAHPKMDDELELSLREAIFFMADELIQKNKRGCTIKELVQGLAAQNIVIKPGTLNRYLNEYQGMKKAPGSKKEASQSETQAGRGQGKSDSPQREERKPPVTPANKSDERNASSFNNKLDAPANNPPGLRGQATPSSAMNEGSRTSFSPKSEYENLI